jgi:hypothetical protein
MIREATVVTGDEYSSVRALMAADGGCLEGTGGICRTWLDVLPLDSEGNRKGLGNSELRGLCENR